MEGWGRERMEGGWEGEDGWEDGRGRMEEEGWKGGGRKEGR